MTLETIESWSTIVASVVTALGLPVAIATYSWRKKEESKKAHERLRLDQQRQDDETYSQLFADYMTYLQLVMKYPELDLGEEELRGGPRLDDLTQVQAAALCNVFLSLAERAFLLYGASSNELRLRQWDGWREYILLILKRPHVQDIYRRHRTQYDTSFVDQIDIWLKEIETN